MRPSVRSAGGQTREPDKLGGCQQCNHVARRPEANPRCERPDFITQTKHSAPAPRVVVITGASAGVGRAAAQAFAREGARIGLIARSREALEDAQREVEALGGEALVLPRDVADAAGV